MTRAAGAVDTTAALNFVGLANKTPADLDAVFKIVREMDSARQTDLSVMIRQRLQQKADELKLDDTEREHVIAFHLKELETENTRQESALKASKAEVSAAAEKFAIQRQASEHEAEHAARMLALSNLISDTEAKVRAKRIQQLEEEVVAVDRVTAAYARLTQQHANLYAVKTGQFQVVDATNAAPAPALALPQQDQAGAALAPPPTFSAVLGVDAGSSSSSSVVGSGVGAFSVVVPAGADAGAAAGPASMAVEAAAAPQPPPQQPAAVDSVGPAAPSGKQAKPKRGGKNKA